jgi:outer membrane protein assembly factor BamB
MFLLVISITIPAIGIQSQSNQQQSETIIDWWPMFHHDLTHSGYSTSTGPETNNVLWRYDTSDRITASSPAIVDGKVYIGNDGGKIYCLNSDSGEIIWDCEVGNERINSPAVADGKVYISSYDNKMYCLNANNGSKIWNFTTSDYICSDPAIVDGNVYFASHDKYTYCLNADTGEKIWDCLTGGWNSPAVVDGRVYIGTAGLSDGKRDCYVYCLNANNGTVIWRYYVGDLVCSSPAVVDGKVYFGADTAKFYCLNAENGSEIWTYQTREWIDSSPAVAYGKVYFGSIDDYVYCLDVNNGSKIWEYYTCSNVPSSPAIADGKVYIGSGCKIYCFNANNGSKIWDYETEGMISSSPSIADGKVYIGSKDGWVYCFDGKKNQPPNKPILNGPKRGKPGKEYDYTFSIIDPNGDDVSYLIDWGDETDSGWIGPISSGQTVTETHEWGSEGTYNVRVKAKDIFNDESDWSDSLSIAMPKNRAINTPLFKFLQNNLDIFLVLQFLLKLSIFNKMLSPL